MLHIVLYEPEIPPNTGNIIRLAANTGAALHLIEPLGFFLDDRRLRRAGLDYHEFSRVLRWDNWNSFAGDMPGERVLALTTRASRPYTEVEFRDGDMLLFGPETRGLPESLLAELPEESRLRIPMRENSRSLNLSNATAIVLYEALRQTGFDFSGTDSP